MKCFWCGRDRKTEECRLRYSRMWINLCSDCKKGFKSKIKETREKCQIQLTARLKK